jgi:hypothetical protein
MQEIRTNRPGITASRKRIRHAQIQYLKPLLMLLENRGDVGVELEIS